MTTEFFYPHIGGLESITESLADEFVNMGHSVIVITNTIEKGNKVFPYIILRNPSIKELWKAYIWCDIFVHQQLSLKRIWPLFLKRKPWIVTYHQVGWQSGILGIIKYLISKLSTYNVCVSQTTANGYRLKNYEIIYNAYNDTAFKKTCSNERKNIAFVGRLIKGKGLFLLIEAFNKFKEKTGSDYKLSIIGEGKDKNEIISFASQTKFANDIHFLGALNPYEVSQVLNKHHILAVTSTHPYYEAFGIVVLEGLACGCIVVGADGDGIEEALHGVGILYKNGDEQDLCNAIIKAYNLSQDAEIANNALVAEWLNSRTKRKVAEEYIKVFEKYIC